MPIIILLAIFIGTLTINELFDYIMTKQFEEKLNEYLDNNKIVLNEKDTIIVDILMSSFINEITNDKRSLIPIYNIFLKIENLYYLNSDIEDFIELLEDDYGDMLNNSKIKEELNKPINKPLYFISYQKDGKYISAFFTYDGHNINIKDGSPTFKELSEKEQYKTLYLILKDFCQNKNKYNHSPKLDIIMEENGLNDTFNNYTKSLSLVRKNRD